MGLKLFYGLCPCLQTLICLSQTSEFKRSIDQVGIIGLAPLIRGWASQSKPTIFDRGLFIPHTSN